MNPEIEARFAALRAAGMGPGAQHAYNTNPPQVSKSYLDGAVGTAQHAYNTNPPPMDRSPLQQPLGSSPQLYNNAEQPPMERSPLQQQLAQQQQFARQQALEQANQQRQLQDPQYARTQTPEFQAYVAQQKDLDQQMGDYQKQSPIYQQQKDLAGKMNSYMNPGQTDTSLAQSMVMPTNAQNQNFMFNKETLTRAAADPTVAAETPPASMGGKGGYANPRFAVMPQQTQRQPDIPRGLGGLGGKGVGYDPEGGMMSGRPPISNYERGFTNNYPRAGGGGPSNGSGGDLGFGGGGGGGGQKKLTLGEVGLTFDPSGGGGAGGSMEAYAEGGDIPAAPQGLAALGRGNDTQLVHMTPREVGAMQNLAMSQGGSLTINPHTGLPEAGFLDSMLPTILGIGANFLFPGSGALIGAGIGALQTARTGDLGKGIMAGLGAYGGAGIGEGLASMGGNAALQTGAQNITHAPGFSPTDILNKYAPSDMSMASSAPVPNAPIFGSQQLGNAAAGAKQLGTTQGWSDLANKVGGKTLMSAAAAPVMDALQPPPVELAPSPMGQAKKYSYDPKTQQYVLLAGGGAITHMAEGSYVPDSKRVNTNIYDAKKEKERIAKLQQIIAALSGLPNSASLNALEAPVTQLAHGGIASLQEYAAGGKLLQGPGDGMSDSIPAVIKGARPQRAALAQGEFVVPADVVSHLGNGSTDAGAKRLYAMMDKVRHARTGNKKQGKQINPNRFLPT